MRVLVNATAVESRSSGLGHYVISLLKALAMFPVETVVVTPNPELLPGVCSVKSPNWTRSQATRFHSKPRYLYANTCMRYWLMKFHADILFSPNHELMLIPPVPQVVVIHDIIPYFTPEQHRFLGTYYRKFLPGLLSYHVKHIITVSKSTKDDLVEHYRLPAEKITPVLSGPGVTLGYQRLAQDVPRPYILYVGRLAPYKNLCNLVLAMGFLKDRFPHHIVIAGPASLDECGTTRNILETAAMSGLTERLKFLGYVPSEQLGSLYREASLLVLPSLYEGFGFPPLEAMSCGTPVAVSRIPALVETVGDAGLYFDPRSPEDMARAIERVLSDRQLREEMVKRGRERVKSFSWKKTAEGIHKILVDVAGGSP